VSSSPPAGFAPDVVGGSSRNAVLQAKLARKQTENLRREQELKVRGSRLSLSLLSHAKSSLGDAKSSLGDVKSSLGDAKSSLGDTKSSLGDAKSSLGDAKSSLGWREPTGCASELLRGTQASGPAAEGAIFAQRGQGERAQRDSRGGSERVTGYAPLAHPPMCCCELNRFGMGTARQSIGSTHSLPP
jgi:hypothetical protein